MKEFLVINWRWLLEACLVIAAFVLMLIRKKPVKVVDTIQQVILRLLPGLINQAEIKLGAGKGSEKLQFVLDLLRVALLDLGYGDEVVDQYLPFAQNQVEVILSTPKKKVR